MINVSVLFVVTFKAFTVSLAKNLKKKHRNSTMQNIFHIQGQWNYLLKPFESWTPNKTYGLETMPESNLHA